MISGWLHEGFGSYDEAFYVSGAVAIFSSLLLFGVGCMRTKRRDTYVPNRRHPNCECSSIDTENSFGSTEKFASELGHKDAEIQSMLDETCVKTERCHIHGCLKLSDLLLVVDRETVL